MWSPRTATKSNPCSPQLEKAHAQQQRPNAAKKKKKKDEAAKIKGCLYGSAAPFGLAQG